MYSCNKIKPCKLYESQVQNLLSFSEGKDFDDYIQRQNFLHDVEQFIKKMESTYYVEFSESNSGIISILVNDRPIN